MTGTVTDSDGPCPPLGLEAFQTTFQPIPAELGYTELYFVTGTGLDTTNPVGGPSTLAAGVLFDTFGIFGPYYNPGSDISVDLAFGPFTSFSQHDATSFTVDLDFTAYSGKQIVAEIDEEGASAGIDPSAAVLCIGTVRLQGTTSGGKSFGPYATQFAGGWLNEATGDQVAARADLDVTTGALKLRIDADASTALSEAVAELGTLHLAGADQGGLWASRVATPSGVIGAAALRRVGSNRLEGWLEIVSPSARVAQHGLLVVTAE